MFGFIEMVMYDVKYGKFVFSDVGIVRSPSIWVWYNKSTNHVENDMELMSYCGIVGWLEILDLKGLDIHSMIVWTIEYYYV